MAGSEKDNKLKESKNKILKIKKGKISQFEKINTSVDLEHAITDLQNYQEEINEPISIIEETNKTEMAKDIRNKIEIGEKIKLKIYDSEQKKYTTVDGKVISFGETFVEVEYLDLKNQEKVSTKVKFWHNRINN